jgi:sugar O-acyltransferase (sialic acid O-acetyltransferase NeuD family)
MRCVVLGGGGHARLLIATLLDMEGVEVVAALDPAGGSDIHGVPIAGGDEELPVMAARGVDWFVVGVGCVGDTGPRRRLWALARSHGLRPLTVRDHASRVSRFAAVAPGAQLLAGSVINPDARVGINVLINANCVVEHGCKLADHVVLGSGAVLAGGVRVGRGAFIGAGATVIQGLSLGEGSRIAAGAAVIRDVPPGATVMGVPARVWRAES